MVVIDPAKRDAFAGASAGFVSRMVVAPLDLMKIRLQLDVRLLDDERGGTSTRATHNSRNLDYVRLHRRSSPSLRNWMVGQGLINTIRTIHAEEGLRTFWRGNAAATLLWMSYAAVQFSMYNVLRRRSNTSSEKQKLSYALSLRPLLNGTLAGAVATTMTFPLDVLRTRFAGQGTPRLYKGYSDLAVVLLKEGQQDGGLLGTFRPFFRGLAPSLVMVAPYIGLNFGLYEIFAGIINGADESTQYWYTPLVSGALSGACSKLLVYPLDTVKKRMQAAGMLEHLGLAHDQKNVGTIRCGIHIVQREGVRALFRGVFPALLKVAPASAITFSVFDLVRGAISAACNTTL